MTVWPIMAAYASFAFLFKIFFPKVKVVLTLQEGDPLAYITNLKRFKFFKPFYKFYFKQVNKVQTISNFLADWAKTLGVAKEKIVVVPNGVDVEKFNQQRIINAQNTKYNINGKKVILTDSRLEKKNGVADLIRALAILKETNDDITLLVIGDGTEKIALNRLAVELGLTDDHLKFLGKIPYDEIQNYYALADVFARPSLSEGFGNVFIQAMATGIPVIATPVGGIVDFLKDGETGWFCEVNNPKSIAEKIKYVLAEDNQSEVKRVADEAKNMVTKKYSWGLIAQQMKDILIF